MKKVPRYYTQPLFIIVSIILPYNKIVLCLVLSSCYRTVNRNWKWVFLVNWWWPSAILYDVPYEPYHWIYGYMHQNRIFKRALTLPLSILQLHFIFSFMTFNVGFYKNLLWLEERMQFVMPDFLLQLKFVAWIITHLNQYNK